MTPPIQASHIFPIRLYFPLPIFPQWIGLGALLWSHLLLHFSTWFSPLCSRSRAVGGCCFPEIVFLKSCIVAVCLWHSNLHSHAHTLWLNTRFWSYLVKCVYHYSTPWAYAAGAQYFAERLFEGFVPQVYFFPFGEHIGDKCLMCYPFYFPSVNHPFTYRYGTTR